MPTAKNSTERGRTADDLSKTTIFDLLASDRRRHALEYLADRVGAAPLDDVADELALLEGEYTAERCERVATSLVHVHVPKLVEAGVIGYDPEASVLDLGPAADQLEPYLDVRAPAAR